MGNIYGVAGNSSASLNESVTKFDSSSYKKMFESDRALIYCDGGKTCYAGKLDSGESYVVSGVGIKEKIYDSDDWQRVISSGSLHDNFPEGHYIIIRLDGSRIKFYTDPSGIRDLYFLQTEELIYFSTRLDWLANFKELKINFAEFGTRWLLFNQLSHNAVVSDVQRITAGTETDIYFDSMRLDVFKHDYEMPFTQDEYSFDKFFEKLNSLVALPSINSHPIALSLSGGMDSRVILSYLMNASSSDWDAHTFGEKGHPDAVVAASIAGRLNIDHSLYTHAYDDSDHVISKLKDYTCQTLVNNSASAIIQLDLYGNLTDKDHIIIDGGFGEIWRRDFFNRLLYKGKKGMREKNPHDVFEHIKVHRADIFNDEINKKMYDGALEQINELFEDYSDIDELGIENWIDLIGIRTRLVNYYGPEQARLDASLVSYMPFAQKSLLDLLFSVPVAERKNGKLFRRIISKNYPLLKTFPLAKGSFTYPYRMGTIESRIYSMVRSRLKWKLYSDDIRTNFLNLYSEYIIDLVNSSDVRECSLYDYAKVKRLADEYYAGNNGLAHDLDWWLSFDEFRRGLRKARSV